jgi:hypothetical protein
VLTCYHVIATAFPAGLVRVVFPHGEYVARVSRVDAENDCALLRFERPITAVAPLVIQAHSIEKAARWESFGYPAATWESGLLIEGEVQDSLGTNLRRCPSLVLHSRNATAGALMQGFSGSPVVAGGVVIGQLQQIVPDERNGAQFGVLFATPASALLSMLPRSTAEVASPYVGLSAFQREDAPRFFGRETLTARLYESYRAAYFAEAGARLITILGPSGAGKSSLARAGLLPALVQRPIPGPPPRASSS